MRADTATLLGLAEAVFRRRRVRLAYEAFDGRRSERELSPFGLVVHQGRWYLAAHDHRRRALRTFRADRVTGLELLAAATATPPEGFDVIEHIERALSEVPWRWTVRVSLVLPVEETRRRISGTLARVAEAGDGSLVTVRADSLDWVASLLAGLNCDFEVIEPRKELGEALDRLAERLLRA